MDYKPQKITHLSQLPIDDSGYSPGQQQPPYQKQNSAAATAQINEQSGLKVPRGPVGVDTTYKPIDQFPNPYGVGPKTEVDFSQPLLQPLSHDIPTSPYHIKLTKHCNPIISPNPKSHTIIFANMNNKLNPIPKKAPKNI